MTILGIETSCDETSAAVVKFKNGNGEILSLETATSLTLHVATGGIIPERAAREQLKYILPVIDTALSKAFANAKFKEEKTAPPIDVIAVTHGPGLIGSLLVGVETAKTLALLWDKPLIPVNHLYGHIYANWLRAKSEVQSVKPYAVSSMPYAAIPFPAIALVVSGGHTDLVLMESHQKLKVIGGTRDDAAGEGFDKIGRLLGLSYPAGHEIARLSEKGDARLFKLPRPMLDSKDFDFSFSGLKTSVLNLLKKNNWDFSPVILEGGDSRPIESQKKRDPITSFQDDKKQLLYDLCASVEEAIVDVLVKKTLNAAKKYKVKSILLGGGVAANKKLREQLALETGNWKLEIGLFVPPPSLCTDNGAMIAAAAYFNRNETPIEEITADPELYY